MFSKVSMVGSLGCLLQHLDLLWLVCSKQRLVSTPYAWQHLEIFLLLTQTLIITLMSTK